MKTLGIRDIIGPVMIGPSSSHTAGAVRIGLMTRHLLAAAPVKVEFRLYGSFAHTYHGHGTDRALLAGILGLTAEDERIRDSFALAEEAQLAYEFIPVEDTETEHPNTVDIDVRDALGNSTSVRGESLGGGAARITRLNGIDVELTGEYHSLVVKHKDEKGALAFIATCVARFEINIATTRLFRERPGDIAYTVMETDDAIPEALLGVLEEHAAVLTVRALASDSSHDALAPVSAQAGRYSGEEPAGFGTDLTLEAARELFEQIDFKNGAELLAYCQQEQLPISDAICRRERCMLIMNGFVVDDTRRYLYDALKIMKASIAAPLTHPQPSMGGLIGGEAQQLASYETSGNVLCGSLIARAITYGMAVLETNATMGRIVAAPTAGSAGVVPAALFSLQEERGLTDTQLNRGLANAAAIGLLITKAATVSGAEGGCQAEVGSAAAMAASAIVELMGGTPAQCLTAAANALSGMMGLVCDPLGGLVEAPCQKRNAFGVTTAFTAAHLALAGIDSVIDFDETVWAMDTVGRSLPFELRESALGGLAATPTAHALCAICPGCSG